MSKHFIYIFFFSSFLFWGCKKDEVEHSKGFIKYFGGIDVDRASDVQQTGDGGYIIIGSTRSYGAGGSDIYIVKTDASGNEEWKKTFGSTLDDEGSAVQQTSDGGYVFIGTYRHTSGAAINKTDIYVIKTNASGDTTWTKKYGDFSGIKTNEEGISIKETVGGGYIIAGNTDVGTDGDMLVIKINTTGSITQSHQHPSSNAAGLDQAINILQRPDGAYVMSSNSGGLNSPRIIFVNTIISGAPNAPTKNEFFQPSMQSAGEVALTPDGQFVLTGKTNTDDIFLIKFKNSVAGYTTWFKTFGGGGIDEANSVQPANEGYIIVGSTTSFGAGSKDIFLVKVDANGNQEWTKTFGGTGLDVGRVVRKTSDGGYVILGTLEFGDDPSTQDNIMCLIKVNEKGEIKN